MARRYNKRNSLSSVLHGRDVSDCLPRNRGKHRRRWQTKNCAHHGQYRGGRKGEGGGDIAGDKHHGTSTTGLSCRRRLLRMRVSVVLQEHAVRLQSGRPQLCVLLVSGAVRQRCAPDPAGRAADDTERTRGRRGEAEREEATRARKGRANQGAHRGIGEGRRKRKRKSKRHRTTERPTHTAATGNQREREEGGR